MATIVGHVRVSAGSHQRAAFTRGGTGRVGVMVGVVAGARAGRAGVECVSVRRHHICFNVIILQRVG